MHTNVSSDVLPKIMVFRPTWDEFKDFNNYIQFMESQEAHKAGIAKIIPPKEWKPRKLSYVEDDVLGIQIPAPIIQKITGKGGSYIHNTLKMKAMSLSSFKCLSETDQYKTPIHLDYDDLERKFWKNITYNPPIYGADVSATVFDADCDIWNVNKLGTILDYLKDDYGVKIDGVNTPYLYIGMWKSAFPWHTEDMDLYSINYLHFGSPKTWYAIPPEYGRQFERLAAAKFSMDYNVCSAFIRHKMCFISPNTLNDSSIPWDKITQEPGEIIITFPYGFHSGFNHGFNIAEAINFATKRWVEYGKRAMQCKCKGDMVKFSMDTFIKRLQPEKYEQWIQGKDYGHHPEESKRLTPRPAGPTKPSSRKRKIENKVI